MSEPKEHSLGQQCECAGCDRVYNKVKYERCPSCGVSKCKDDV